MLNQINIQVLKVLKSKVNPNEKNSYNPLKTLDNIKLM
jgi:hypothetical protein